MVLIIGILAAIALPQYRIAVEKSRFAQTLPLFRSLLDAQKRYEMANGTKDTNVDLFDINFAYSSKNEFISEGTVQGTQYYTKSVTGDFALSPDGAIFWHNIPGGYVVDFYGDNKAGRDYSGICYPYAVGTQGERVCKAFGRSLGTMSSAGTPMYAISF